MEFNDDEYVDVNLEGTTKTGIDWAKEYDECGGGDNSWLDIAVNYCLKAGLDADSFNTQEQVEEFLAGVSYDEMVEALGTPDEAVKEEQQPGFSDENYIDPETNLEAGYDEDFTGVDESCCGGKKKAKKKSKFVPFWAKKKSKEVDEAVELLRNAGYLVE